MGGPQVLAVSRWKRTPSKLLNSLSLELEDFMTSELSQVQKYKCCMISTCVSNVKEVISTNKQKQKGSARSQERADDGDILIIWSR